jgi:hypothetical protein
MGLGAGALVTPTELLLPSTKVYSFPPARIEVVGFYQSDFGTIRFSWDISDISPVGYPLTECFERALNEAAQKAWQEGFSMSELDGSELLQRFSDFDLTRRR